MPDVAADAYGPTGMDLAISAGPGLGSPDARVLIPLLAHHACQ
jgi:hypothetical protein